MDADKKIALALPLSSNDIETLRKDPNSLVSKTERDCEFEVALDKAILNHYLETAMHENYLTAKMEEAAEKDAAIHRNEKTIPLQSHVQSTTLKTEQPQNDLRTLLAIPQNNMMSKELAEHHQKLIGHFNAQVIGALGPQITLGNGRQLKVPTTPATSVTIEQVLKVNPTVSSEVQQDSTLQKALAVYQSKMETGALNVLNEYRKILSHNGIDDLPLKERMELIRVIDEVVSHIKDNNPELAQAVLKNNTRAVELFVKALEAEYSPKVHQEETLAQSNDYKDNGPSHKPT